MSAHRRPPTDVAARQATRNSLRYFDIVHSNITAMAKNLSQSQLDLMAHYDFVLCSNAEQLRGALRLRLEVFADEQGFSADTEVDEYDPISAHFIVTRRQDTAVVATVRLTPFPRKQWLKHVEPASMTEPSAGASQNKMSMVMSGGGPGGSSGGLAMTTRTADSSETKTRGATASASSDAAMQNGYPLGWPIPAGELAQRFLKSAKLTNDPADDVDEHHAPPMHGAKISRLAVAQSERGKRLGALVMQQAEGWLVSLHRKAAQNTAASSYPAKEPDTASTQFDIVISSQMPAKPFYEKLGYSVYGEPYDEEGAPHCWCVKTLQTATPLSEQRRLV